MRLGLRVLYLGWGDHGTRASMMGHEAGESADDGAPEPIVIRRPGALREQILMAEDFDVLPDDVLEAMEAGDPISPSAEAGTGL